MKPLAVVILKSIMGSFVAIIASSIIFYLIIVEPTAFAYPIHPNVTVDVNIPGQGVVLGNYDTTLWSNQLFMQFRGIPFAESPTGNYRFKPPVARSPWSHYFDATNFGQRCPVITTVSELTPQQLSTDLEDCLNLCVYTKNLTAKQPVMFYIYGGGFYNGSASDHPPRHLLEKDIVLVVPQYRIGALGWATTLTNDMPGNAPIGDILLALQWVQTHIHAFGGDPGKVTIFGQSAGAGVAGALLLSPKTPPNSFQRAIVQSGSIFANWAVKTDPRVQVERICRALNCTTCVSDEELHSCLQAAPVLELLQVTAEESFSPAIGDLGGILPKLPKDLLSNYNSKLPVMMGFTKHDGSFVLATYYDALKQKVGNLSLLSVRDFANGIMDMSNDGSELARQLHTRLLFSAEQLATHEHKKALSGYFDLVNNIFMKSPVITLATKLIEQRGVANYLYSFDYNGSNTRFGYEFGNEHYPFEGGVHHSNDNIYLFSTHKLNAPDTLMAKKMVDLWTSFAINGKPSAEDSIDIPAMSSPSGPYFHIDKTITIGEDVLKELTATIDDPESEQLDRVNIEF